MTYGKAVEIVERFLDTLDRLCITTDKSDKINYVCESELTDVIFKLGVIE